MSTETNIDLLVAAQAGTIKDVRAGMSGNAGEASGNAAAITALLAGQGFTSTNILSAIFELSSDISAITIADTDSLAEGMSNLYFSDIRVSSSPLPIIPAASGGVVQGDTVLQAIAKLESHRQVFGTFVVDDSASGLENLWTSVRITSDLDAIGSRPNLLTNFVTIDTTQVLTTDTISSAVGKLQGQLNNIDLTDIIDDSITGLTTTWSSTEIDSRIQSVIDTAPAALDTLNELASALGDDANFSATVTTNLGLKANSADVYTKTELGPTFTTRDWSAEWTAAIA